MPNCLRTLSRAFGIQRSVPWWPWRLLDPYPTDGFVVSGLFSLWATDPAEALMSWRGNRFDPRVSCAQILMPYGSARTCAAIIHPTQGPMRFLFVFLLEAVEVLMLGAGSSDPGIAAIGPRCENGSPLALVLSNTLPPQVLGGGHDHRTNAANQPIFQFRSNTKLSWQGWTFKP